jgi:epoxyqueuosine reductase
MSNRKDLAVRIKEKAHELGFEFCGVTAASSFGEFLSNIAIRTKRFPESKDLYAKLKQLGHPKKNSDWAESIIVSAYRYGKYKIPKGIDHLVGKYYLADGRLDYAPEYSMGQQFEAWLQELGLRTFRGGVPFRWAAARAGIGRFGKNNFIYTTHGSWVRLDAWMVDREMEYDQPSETSACPEDCTRCIDACPTGALSGPFLMNYGACVSHLNHGVHDLAPLEYRDRMGTWLYGCDVCQNVCPLNQRAWEGKEAFPALEEFSRVITLENLWQMDDESLMKIVHPKLWYIERDRLWLWRCNVLRAMANSRNSNYLKYIRGACKDADDRIREMALWALKRIETSRSR